MMMSVEAPERVAQREAALKEGNRVRIERAQLKRDIRAFTVDVTEVIESPPEAAWTMTVETLLLSLHRFGQHRVEKVLNGVCRPGLTLEALTRMPHTRAKLIAAVDEALGRR